MTEQSRWTASTLRSGKIYKQANKLEDMTSGDDHTERPDPMAEMLQLLMEDRRRHDEEVAEERRQRAEEQIRDKERRLYEDERREIESQRQMELFQGLLTGIHKQGESAERRAEKDRDVKLTKLAETDDIEAYLTTFERMMTSYEIPADRWVYKLAPHLTGQAQKAYAAMPTDEAIDYETVKKTILIRYDITKESYRHRFRTATRKTGESSRELATRLNDLASKWLQECKTVDEVRDLIVMEQVIDMLPLEVRIFVKERQPGTSAEAAKLADDYWQARKPSLGRRMGPQAGLKFCHTCGKQGHLSKDCRNKTPGKPDWKPQNSGVKKDLKDLKDIECFNCHKKGHYSSNCPERAGALFCTERRIDYQGQSNTKKTEVQAKPSVVKTGSVEGKKVDNILLDTGCSRTLIRKDLVPQHKLLHGEVVAIRCAHGDTVLYPLAEVDLEVEGYLIHVEAAISDTLPMPVLLGTDVPELTAILRGDPTTKKVVPQQALAVVTRASAIKQREEEEMTAQKEKESGAHSKTLGVEMQLPVKETVDSESESEVQNLEIIDNENLSDVPFQDLEDELFIPSRNRETLTRKEKRQQRAKHFEKCKNMQSELHPLDISLSKFKELQQKDDTLKQCVEAAEGSPSTAGVGFYQNDGLLYRRWIPPKQGADGVEVEQLVLPRHCREEVLKLAHSVPLAGHMGKEKTARRILQRFYWPTLYQDVAKYCKGCLTCQKSTQSRTKRAPLIPLPTIQEPFKRIAMDIVGPLPRSNSGKRYILVICDYATRYPEAIPLKSIDAPHIAEQLMTLFSRVGIPEEILTDQGSNFTSTLLTEIYRMLHVHPIRTTPYHPQTDGLVERFNQTLKRMLRKATKDEGKDWDKVIPYLLFAYREVPQSSTGFSPFELLYGRSVRGPLDIVREAWQTDKCDSVSIISYIMKMRDRLERATQVVKVNLDIAKQIQKTWYDQNSRQREFHQGDQVLVLLPTSSNKLLAQWQGPYEVVKPIGKVDYLIHMYDRRKKRRIFHVNMLKQWYVPTNTGYIAEEIEADYVDEDIPTWTDDNSTQIPIDKRVDTPQRAQLQSLLDKYQDVFKNQPGRTSLTEHRIITGDARPIRLPPYRIPHAHRDAVREEIGEMLEQGIIEPSSSAYGSPIVLVTKKDKSLRICVDYRKLNCQSQADAYPMPRIDDLIDGLGRSHYISTLDLTKGYWQVPVAVEDRPKTAFVTPFGLFQFKVMPFGLQGAPATFQRLMDRVIAGLSDFTATYLDDVIIFSETWEKHLEHVRTTLQRLRKAGLTVKAKKSQFGAKYCTYLGHIVGGGVVQPGSTKVQAVREFPVPVTKKQVRTFLGLSGYYRRFIPQYADIASPLTDLTRKAAPSDVIWTDTCEQAFQKLKTLLSTSPILASPDFTQQFILQTDASDRGIGAVLSQLDGTGMDRPVAYYSKKLLPREERYSVIEKECLAIKAGVAAFQVYLLGRPFTIQTDHRALMWLNQLKDKNSRLTRWSLSLQPYRFEVVHRKGVDNSNADALSRAPNPI
ncbi:uncharacterized protein LOC135345747 [Halichondria panicea]|uniref:uncharacterized protein LOC135345747 n=1 Tax=Halichondria panicea TaxID=6063 RepID=UPI00312BAFB5